jgi:pimeloyl-ACP methyl ester carboxylesterase
VEQSWPQRPVVVEQGPSSGPALMVIDPAGALRLGRLPLAWESMAECVRVVWFDSTALDDPLVDARIALERQARTRDVYLVANRDGEQLATLLAAHRPDVVRGVFLIVRPGTAATDSATPRDRTRGELGSFLDDHGVLARSLQPNGRGTGKEQTTAGIDTAAVVEVVARELLALGVDVESPSASSVRREPEPGGSVLGHAASAAWEEVGFALHGLRNSMHWPKNG